MKIDLKNIAYDEAAAIAEIEKQEREMPVHNAHALKVNSWLKFWIYLSVLAFSCGIFFLMHKVLPNWAWYVSKVEVNASFALIRV